jgi:CubicO group peptidase (beta-lactamase class C family)
MVTRAGSVEVELAQGPADIESGTECTVQTRFQLCSVSKQFAAAAALLLVESGQLDLNEPVEGWLPGGTPQWRQITLHHLLSHTAGLPHWLEAPGLDPAVPMSITERLAAVQQGPLRTEPGAQWHYSSLGFVLAGLIVARASGQPYPAFLAERILSPLKLTSTTVGGGPAGAAFARGFAGGQPVPPWDLDAMPGTGDIWSTAGDLTRFITALHAGELITAGSLTAMCTPHAPLDDDDAGEPRLTTTGYGYGMFTGTFGGHPAYYHPGDNPGYRSFAGWIPDRAASIVILVNREDAEVSIEGLLRQLLPAALEP